MTIYAVGDLQGCCTPLERLLEAVRFDLTADRVWLVGDLVNRGPQSLKTLRLVRALGSAATCVLGNHDIHLLAVAAGVRRPSRQDTLNDILHAPDCDELLDWVRSRPLAHRETVAGKVHLMVHAGVLPQWSADQTVALAAEVSAALAGPKWQEFLSHAFGNEPARWDESLTGMARLRVIINALTRLRLCSFDGEMDMESKGAPAAATGHFMPWFEVPERRAADVRIVIGHWSTLGFVSRENLIALDTGCVWGGKLTAVALESGVRSEVSCPQSQRPG